MKVYDVSTIRKRFDALSERTNEALGMYDDSTVGIGRYVPGTSPWERHSNGDELLLVTDGEVEIEVLDDDGASQRFTVVDGGLFVVPRGKWHQLTATDNVTILFASPSEDGAERTRQHPLGE
ncbi:MAG: cupin domain-containing protein [Myxococcales bacterium]|nr:cupin domain-containing protein [Myxococcales bacterium]